MRQGSIRERWTKLRTNPHVCTECNALVFVLLAIATMVTGLHVAAAACAIFAVLLLGSDAHDWWQER